MVDLVPIWYHDRYWFKVFISTHDCDLEVNFPNLIIDLIHLWYDDTYWSKILLGFILTRLVHVKVKVTVMSKFSR